MRCLYDGPHPCGKCPACLANRQRAFCFRLDQEKESATFYFWLTLQYDDDHVPRLEDGEMCFSKEHCRTFFEKLRQRYASDGHKFKHFLVSEYGPNATHRPHYHCLLLVYNDYDLAKNYLIRKEMKDFILHEAWPNGYVCEKSFHGRVIRYLTKYCLKPELLGEKHTMKPFTLISRGMGLNYLDKLDPRTLEHFKSSLDFRVRYGNGWIDLPRYYVDKILPHSKAELDSLLPSDPEDPEAWKDYLEFKSTRDRILEKNNKQVNKRAKLIHKQETDLNIISQNIRDCKNQISAAYANFRASVKLRKDL